MENQQIKTTSHEELVERLPGVIRTLAKAEDKATCMTWLGDARYAQYRETGNQDYLQLARNCYVAARRFQSRSR